MSAHTEAYDITFEVRPLGSDVAVTTEFIYARGKKQRLSGAFVKWYFSLSTVGFNGYAVIELLIISLI